MREHSDAPLRAGAASTASARLDVRRGPSRLWQILLLVPLPPLSFLYLHLLRAGRVIPSFGTVLVLALFPLASLFLGARRIGSRPANEGPATIEIVLVAMAVTEIAWAAVTAAAAGFAMAVAR